MIQTTTNQHNDYDVTIVGAGLVGAALALSLRSSKLRVALIDHQSSEVLQTRIKPTANVHEFEPRVSALTASTQTFLTQIGVWQTLNTLQIQPYQAMHVWDELGTASIEFDAAELYQDSLGCIIENQLLLSALHEQLQCQENLDCFFGESIKRISIHGKGRLIELQTGEVMRSALLIAADGANSKIRQWEGMPTREWDYQHHAIVATVETSDKHQNTAWQRFSEEGPLAFLPLADSNHEQRFSSIVWSQETAKAASLMALSDSEFCQQLSDSIERKLGSVEAVSQRYSIPLRQRHAKDYVKPGVVLLGDAAHTIHPLAGQGVNLGFKDAQVLSEVLLEAERLSVSVNDMVLLKRYQRRRQGDNLLMMGAMEGFKRLFGHSDPLVRWARNTGMAWVNKQHFLKNQLAKHAMGLSL